jgi:hypothetical protein
MITVGVGLTDGVGDAIGLLEADIAIAHSIAMKSGTISMDILTFTRQARMPFYRGVRTRVKPDDHR